MLARYFGALARGTSTADPVTFILYIYTVYIHKHSHTCVPGTHLSNDVRFNADTVATDIRATCVRV